MSLIDKIITFALHRDPRPTMNNIFQDHLLITLILISIAVTAVLVWILHALIRFLIENGYIPYDLIIWILSTIIVVDLFLTWIHWGEL
jgi:hypothetical protein